MGLRRNIVYTTLLLAFVAGFCDAATFTAADQLFSAHVTGNFIVFAYDLVKGADTQTWTKLISFPVYIAAVIGAGWIAPRLSNGYRLLFIEGVILFVSGALAVLMPHISPPAPWWGTVMPFLVVAAMGIQNAFGRMYSKTVFAQTTVMTGNVTQLILEFSRRLGARHAEGSGNRANGSGNRANGSGNSANGPGNGGPGSGPTIGRQTAIVCVFLAGCIAGAVAASDFGLWTVVFPGAALVGLGAL
jgi:uncharacterized membrane protein YoaK (UPF0700 family)